MIISPNLLYDVVITLFSRSEIFWVALNSTATLGLFLFVVIAFYQETKRAREISTLKSRPFIHLGFEQIDGGIVYLLLKNYGELPAYNISLKLLGDLKSGLWEEVEREKLGKLSEISWFTEPIGMLAPGQSLKLLYTTREYLISEYIEKYEGCDVEISYQDPNMKVQLHTPKYKLDPKVLAPFALQNISASEDALKLSANALSKISMNIDKLSKSGNKSH